MTLFDIKSKNKQGGLVAFNLLCQTMTHNLGSNKELASLIDYNSNTLESLHIRPRLIRGDVARNIENNDENRNLLEVLPSTVTQHLYSLTHLRDLGFHAYMSGDLTDFGIDLGTIVRNCSMLESLALEEISIRDTDMYQITTHSKNLRRFRLVLGQQSNHYTVWIDEAFLEPYRSETRGYLFGRFMYIG